MYASKIFQITLPRNCQTCQLCAKCSDTATKPGSEEAATFPYCWALISPENRLEMSLCHVLTSPFQIRAKKSIEKLQTEVFLFFLFFFNLVQFIQSWFPTFSPGPLCLTQLCSVKSHSGHGWLKSPNNNIRAQFCWKITVNSSFPFPCLSAEPQTPALSGILTLFPSGHRCLHHLSRLTPLLSYHCILLIKQYLWADLFSLSRSV